MLSLSTNFREVCSSMLDITPGATYAPHAQFAAKFPAANNGKNCCDFGVGVIQRDSWSCICVAFYQNYFNISSGFENVIRRIIQAAVDRFCHTIQGYFTGNGIHYDDVIISAIASHITSLTVVYSTVYCGADQRKHQSSALLAFVWGIHRDRWIPRTKGQLRGKYFHLMTSSWIIR